IPGPVPQVMWKRGTELPCPSARPSPRSAQPTTGKSFTPIERSHSRFSPAANWRYASAQRRGQVSSAPSNPAEPNQSWRASATLSRTPRRRCSGVSTRNSPPKLHQAWPPRSCSPSRSSSRTRRPASASVVAATRPARPAPTTITSGSPPRPALSAHPDPLDALERVGLVAPGHAAVPQAGAAAHLLVSLAQVPDGDLRLPLVTVALVGVAVVAVDDAVDRGEHCRAHHEGQRDEAAAAVAVGEQHRGGRRGHHLSEQREHRHLRGQGTTGRS